MDKKIKYSIILILIIIIIISICIVLIKLEEENENIQEVENQIQLIETVKKSKLEKETGIYTYLYSNEIINKLFEYISEKELNVKNAEAIINILDEDYKNKNNLTEENVLSFLSKYKDINSYCSKEIYKQEVSQRQNLNGKYIYIKGIARKNGEEEYIYILIKQDLVNSTYSIAFMEEKEFNNIDNNELEIVIQKNIYNNIYSKAITDYQICLEYLNDYLNTIRNKPNEGYKLLNEEYKNKRFSTIEAYVEYINSIQARLNSTVLKQYSIEEENEKIQYVCVDQRGNYYIFEINEVMDYKLILDTYTLELPQFIEKYNKANTMEKVGYNIQKCIEAINNKDYSYVYNKLDNNFKEKNYKTLENLKHSIENNLFANNIVGEVVTSNEGNTYIYEMTIKDADNNDNIKNMTIIMQLKQGTDFVMSFSFK